MKCLIISGGDFFDVPKEVSLQSDLIIACDKGYEYALRLGLVPNLIIGDFDSASVSPEGLIAENNAYAGLKEKSKIIRLPKDKDDTDTMAGVKYGLEKSCDDFTFVCAAGGRLDHFLCNLQVMEYTLNQIEKTSPIKGCRVRLYSQKDEIYIIKDTEIEIPRRTGWSLSVFSLSDKSEGLYEKGSRWTLNNAVMMRSLPYGISNEWTDEKALIGVKKGTLAVILSKLD